MAELPVQRRLAAIAVADVVGYSRLMGADENGTLAALRQLRTEILNPTVREHGGRIVKVMGDGVLVEFASAVNAVTAAIELQNKMALANEPMPENRRIVLRIGINLGDVIGDGSDIYGDGVNIATRLEALAEPGGVCISGKVFDDVRDRVTVRFRDLGEKTLKNIARPVRAYALNTAPAPAIPPVAHGMFPSLAVLPFENMSGDPEQEYFVDGIVEDIITALSRFKSFAVIARNSSFVYKGHAVDVRQIAKELGVRYVLEGSGRRAGNRLRISAQLVDGISGAHIWADKFDGAFEDVFDVQDRITESVVAVVEPKIQRAEIDRSRRERPESLDAYDLYLQALPDVFVSRPDANARAIVLLERSIALDPGFAPALAMTGQAYLLRVAMQFPGASNADAERALAVARAALAIVRDDAMVLSYGAFVLIHMGGDYHTGIALLRRAISENPNNAMVLQQAGVGALLGGDLGEAADYLQRALRLNPNELGTHWQLTGMAHIRMAEGRYEEALDWAMRSQAVNSGYDANHWMLIAANAYLGHMDEARKHLAALESISPGVNLARIRRGQHAIDPHRIEVLIEGMRMAGMRKSGD
ncbi:adenylate/guanylate cyclase domain-containing protein [Rhizobium leguminosarum]